MKRKVLVFSCILLILVVGIVGFYYNNDVSNSDNTEQFKIINPKTGEIYNSIESYIYRDRYYGPVPEGYDQNYFYSTGKMRLLNNG